MNQQTLKNHYNKLNWVNCPDYSLKPIESFPASQGYLIIELIKRYKLPFKALAYYRDIVGIKTKSQAFIWRDTGIGATFLGIVNFLDDTIIIKEDKEVLQHNEVRTYNKPFNSFKALNDEIEKRDYNNILGLTANITKEDYYNFLEVLPPLKMGDNWFILSEALTDERYLKFTSYSKNNVYICEVIQMEAEE